MNVFYRIISFQIIFLVAKVETMLASSLSQSGRLRQSVLKSAFEGRLV